MKTGSYKKQQKGFRFVKVENEEEEIYVIKEKFIKCINGDIVNIE